MNKQQLNKWTNTLRERARIHAQDHLDTAQILFTIKSGRIYELTGYESFQHFVEESSIGMTPRVANIYAGLYQDWKRLKYRKLEIAEIITDLGMHRTAVLLKEQQKKATLSTLQRKSRNYYRDRPQVNFMLTPEVQQRLDALLIQHGMDIHDSGRRAGVADALVSLLDSIEGRRAA